MTDLKEMSTEEFFRETFSEEFLQEAEVEYTLTQIASLKKEIDETQRRIKTMNDRVLKEGRENRGGLKPTPSGNETRPPAPTPQPLANGPSSSPEDYDLVCVAPDFDNDCPYAEKAFDVIDDVIFCRNPNAQIKALKDHCENLEEELSNLQCENDQNCDLFRRAQECYKSLEDQYQALSKKLAEANKRADKAEELWEKEVNANRASNETKKLKKALKRACTEIENIIGTCPHDYKDMFWETKRPGGCAENCNNSNIESCWIEYFLEEDKND